MKKVFIIFALLAFAFSFTGCGGGGGSLDSPKGENPGKSTLVELTPSHFVSHTNSDITLHATVLDGNGNPVRNKAVRFTNLSPIGVLNEITDNTDANGIATVTLHSHEVGFATIQAEVDEGLNQVRDRTIVFYSDFALAWPQPYIALDIDADSDGIYNEPSDFNFFETPTDDTATLRATAFDEFGKRIVGMNVTFSGDSGASFPLGDTFMTNSNGQAFTTLKVSPTSVVGQETSLLVQAVGSNGSADSMVVFLRPVFITGITLTASPTGVISGETSTVTATITTSAGTIPDDIAVQFSVSPATLGSVAPVVALTDNGAAQTTFTPSDTQTGTATITASLANFTGSVNIVVTTELTVSPESLTVSGLAGGTATYVISGGVAPYALTADTANAALLPPATVAASGPFTITVPPGTSATTVTYTVRDSAGHSVTATLEITSIDLSVFPSSQTIVNPTGGDFATYSILGGAAPYLAFSSHPSLVTTTVAGTTLTATVIAVPVTDTNVTITILDADGTQITATLILDVPAPLTLTPANATLTTPAAGATQTYTIAGGTPTYINPTSSNACVTVAVAGSTLTATYLGGGGCAALLPLTVTVGIQDSGAPTQNAASTLTLQP
jgi:hypothetical protein